jgi:hypothetical protein
LILGLYISINDDTAVAVLVYYGFTKRLTRYGRKSVVVRIVLTPSKIWYSYISQVKGLFRKYYFKMMKITRSETIIELARKLLGR